jgi:hypothetical protein
LAGRKYNFIARDGLVKNRHPGANRGPGDLTWIPAYAGMTTFYETISFDGSVKSRRNPNFVIPVKTGIQCF